MVFTLLNVFWTGGLMFHNRLCILYLVSKSIQVYFALLQFAKNTDVSNDVSCKFLSCVSRCVYVCLGQLCLYATMLSVSRSGQAWHI